MKTKKVVCSKCEGRGYILHYENFPEGTCRAWNEPCSDCHGIGLIEVPMTNADWIRSMNDEELAKNRVLKVMRGDSIHGDYTSYLALDLMKKGFFNDKESAVNAELNYLTQPMED